MTSTINRPGPIQTAIRILLGLFLVFAGTGHLTFDRQAFQAQVPPWVPMNPDLVVVLSGIVEILLGASLVTEHKNAFGLNSDLARWLRLPFQGVLIFAALWSTGAWIEWRKSQA